MARQVKHRREIPDVNPSRPTASAARELVVGVLGWVWGALGVAGLVSVFRFGTEKTPVTRPPDLLVPILPPESSDAALLLRLMSNRPPRTTLAPRWRTTLPIIVIVRLLRS